MQRKYFQNVYRQVRDLAAFDIDGIRRGKQSLEIVETVKSWIGIHEILQQVAPELFPNESPHAAADAAEATTHQGDPRRRRQDGLPSHMERGLAGEDGGENAFSLRRGSELGMSMDADQSESVEEGRRAGRRARGTQGSAAGKRNSKELPEMPAMRRASASKRRGSAPGNVQASPTGPSLPGPGEVGGGSVAEVPA